MGAWEVEALSFLTMTLGPISPALVVESHSRLLLVLIASFAICGVAEAVR